jgi:hypothetical protein
LKDFTCAVCKDHGQRLGQKRQVTIQSYIEQNGAGLIGMEVKVKEFFHDGNKIAKMSHDQRLEAVRNFDEISEKDFAGHKIILSEFRQLFKPVWNVHEIQTQVLKTLKKPIVRNRQVESELEPETETSCMICFMDFPVEELHKICGRENPECKVKACSDCLQSWYDQLQPGEICHPANLVCPYCKRTPTIKVISQYNASLCTLMDRAEIENFDASFVYAWCLHCYSIKVAMQRECGQEQEEIKDFVCHRCWPRGHVYIKEIAEGTIKQCPKCHVYTEKTGGCNHIHCNNITRKQRKTGYLCNTHWCWICGKDFGPMSIYSHISSQHIGFFEDL